MGGRIGKSREPVTPSIIIDHCYYCYNRKYNAPCECTRRPEFGHNMREIVFFLMGNSFNGPPDDPANQIVIARFFIAIFRLKNSTCNTTCSGAWWITSDTITEREKEKIRRSLHTFAEGFTSLQHFQYQQFYERIILSAMVLFRTELLPTFREAIGEDETTMIPFIIRLLYWEGIFRKRLSGKTYDKFAVPMSMNLRPDHVQCLHLMQGGHLTEQIRRHKWWNEDFVDSADMNAEGDFKRHTKPFRALSGNDLLTDWLGDAASIPE